MVSTTKRPKLVAILGPNASGKSGLAMRLAKDFKGEIISADSRTIYKGMDIGTGKPTKQDQAAIPHHLIDLMEVDEFFSVADFKKRALESIDDIQKKGKLPILVGGSGLYIDSVLFDFEFRPLADKKERERLNAMSIESLQDELLRNNITLPLNYLNKRHLVRALETKGVKPKKSKILSGSLVIGMDVDLQDLRILIAKRDHQMIKDGLELEVENLMKKYGRDAASLEAIGYREWQAYFEGNQSLQATEDLIVKNSVKYARRQKTWFKRNPHINWFNSAEQAYKFAQQQLLNT